MTKAGRKAVVWAVAIASLAPVSFAASLFWNSATLALGAKDSALEGSAALAGGVSSVVPVTITVFGRSDDTISARIAFSDADGTPVATLERSWSGWELTLDFVVVRSGDGWLAFPFGVMTDSTGGKGTDLIKYYDDDGFPAVFGSSSLGDGGKRALRKIFSIVKTERWVPRFLGTLRHEHLTLREFDAGKPYVVRVSAKGKLSVRH